MLSLTTIFILLYAQYGIFHGDRVDPNWVDALYNAIARSVWAMALGWMVVSTALNYGGVIGNALSWKMWSLPARVSYSAYLIHPLVMLYFIQTSERPLHLDDMSTIFLYNGILTVTLLSSTLFSVAFESPLIAVISLLK